MGVVAVNMFEVRYKKREKREEKREKREERNVF
jgi:hypothetical protein